MDKKKRIILLIALVLLVLGALFYVFRHHKATAQSLTYQGNVDVRQVQLAFNDSNRVSEILVNEGDTVHKGQVLARLDNTTLNLQLAQSKAQWAVQNAQSAKLNNGTRPEELAQVKANMDALAAQAQQATSQLKRMQGAHSASDNQAVSQVELETAQARAQTAQAQWVAAQKAYQLAKIGPRAEDKQAAQAQSDAARAQMALLQQRLDDAELKSPVDGVVRARLLEVGDLASPQKPAFEIALIAPKWVRIYVAETDLARVHTDMSATITIDDGSQLHGKIASIASVAEFTPKTVQTQELRTQLVYEVRVWVDDPKDILKLGMPATVTIEPQSSAS